MKRLIFFSFFLISTLAQAQRSHPIDIAASRAMEDAVTTVDMIEAQQLAYDGWDQLLNLVYKELQVIMSPSTFSALKQSQKAWLTFRDAEFNTINKVYYDELQGTMWRPVAVGKRKEIVRQRVETLLDLYDILSAQEENKWEALAGTWRSMSAAYQPSLSLDNAFMAQWRGEQPEESKLKFYKISNNCNGRIFPDERQVITFYEFGAQDQSTCYFISMPDEDRLDLESVESQKLLSYSRKR